MTLRSVAVACIHGVRLHNGTIRHLSLEFLHHIPRKDVGAVLFSRMELQSHFSVNSLIHLPIEFDEMIRIDVLGEIDLGLAVCASRYLPAAHHRRLSMGNAICYIRQNRRSSSNASQFYKIPSG